jgi:hypothetical protein
VIETAENLKDNVATASVFFTDRVSRSILTLAEHCKKNGAVVVFEPSGVGDPALFEEMSRICDVLKYSDQRAKSFSDLLGDNGARLEIHTSGDEGLRSLLRGHRKAKKMVALSSYDVDVKDTAGAGDWTTAGLIYQLFSEGREALKSLTKSNVSEALQFGQALAALNCQFEGARGAMYQLTRQRFWNKLRALTHEGSGSRGLVEIENPAADRAFPTNVCPSCIGHRADVSTGSLKTSNSSLAVTLPDTLAPPYRSLAGESSSVAATTMRTRSFAHGRKVAGKTGEM